jgi:hypothetical protein
LLSVSVRRNIADSEIPRANFYLLIVVVQLSIPHDDEGRISGPILLESFYSGRVVVWLGYALTE